MDELIKSKLEKYGNFYFCFNKRHELKLMDIYINSLGRKNQGCIKCQTVLMSDQNEEEKIKNIKILVEAGADIYTRDEFFGFDSEEDHFRAQWYHKVFFPFFLLKAIVTGRLFINLYKMYIKKNEDKK